MTDTPYSPHELVFTPGPSTKDFAACATAQAEFMDAMGQVRGDWRKKHSGVLSAAQYNELQAAIHLATTLIVEEVNEELLPALENYKRHPCLDTIRAVLDGLVDSVYVLMQLSNTLGLPFAEAYAEVHRSNMSKRGPDGKVTFREDGKVLKPPGYHHPQLSAILLQHWMQMDVTHQSSFHSPEVHLHP